MTVLNDMQAHLTSMHSPRGRPSGALTSTPAGTPLRGAARAAGDEFLLQTRPMESVALLMLVLCLL
jgi:hypothetical protein